MRHFIPGRSRAMSKGLVHVILAATLGVASFALFALDATTASASVTSHDAAARALAALSSHVGSPGTWNVAIELPGSAALNVGGNAGVLSISCASSGNCSAGGNYIDGSSHLQAFVADESGGTWGSAVEVPGTAALNVGGNAAVNSVSCTSVGNCAAGGAYTDGAGDGQGFVVNETNGTWGTATEVVDPLAIGSVNATGVASLSCSGNGSCSAVGFDVTTGGAPTGYVLSETSGTWSAATEITMTSTLGSGGTGLSAVSCSSPGNCAAEGAGVYQDAAVHGGVAYIPFEVSETGGTWGTPSLFPGLATLNVGLIGVPSAISCTATGDCSTGGTYTDALGNAQAFVADETKGTWGNAEEVPGTATLNVGAALVNSISCTSPGNCGASGGYSTASLPEDFVVNETNGSWGNAEEVPGFATLAVGGSAAITNPISCSSAGNCSSGGGYIDSLGAYQAYVVTEKDGTWGNATESPGSAALNTGGGAQIIAISCSADSGCGAGGYYAIGTQFQALVTDMAPLFIPQTTLSLTSTRGKVGTALRLTTSGGSGTGAVTFSVTNGSAKGCAIAGTSLKATSAGTCVVTATKAGDVTYSAATATTSVVMAALARPGNVTVSFAANSSALSSADKSALSALSKKLVQGASITVTGSAKGNAKLAKGRASAVASYLAGKDHTHASVKTVTTSSANTATVVTTKQ
ncbi:MAG: hypothetical protein ABSE75_13535 [Acidimicrobiales bacterium]